MTSPTPLAPPAPARRARFPALAVLAAIALSGCSVESLRIDPRLKVQDRDSRGEISTSAQLLASSAGEPTSYGPFVRIRGIWDSYIPNSVALELAIQYGAAGAAGYHQVDQAQLLIDGQNIVLQPSQVQAGYTPATALPNSRVYFFTLHQLDQLLASDDVVFRVSDAESSVFGILRSGQTSTEARSELAALSIAAAKASQLPSSKRRTETAIAGPTTRPLETNDAVAPVEIIELAKPIPIPPSPLPQVPPPVEALASGQNDTPAAPQRPDPAPEHPVATAPVGAGQAKSRSYVPQSGMRPPSIAITTNSDADSVATAPNP